MDEFNPPIFSHWSLWLAAAGAAETGPAGAVGGAPGRLVQNLFIPLVVTLGAWFILRAVVKRNQKLRGERTQDSAAGIPHAASTHQRERKTGDARDPELTKLYIELNEFAREMEGRMDTKIAYLKRLIAEAERVMAGLQEGIAEARGQPSTPPARTRPEDPAPIAPESSAEAPQPTTDVLIGGSPVKDSANGGAAARDGLAGRVLDLWRAGKSREELAEAAGIPKGEVELILSLERAREKASPQKLP